MKLDTFPLYDIHLPGVKEPGEIEEEVDRYEDDRDSGRRLSYSKYGGYNGWDDNTIDEAFDGNPELTWNID